MALHAMLPEALRTSLGYVDNGCGGVWAFLFAFSEVQGKLTTLPKFPDHQTITELHAARLVEEEELQAPHLWGHVSTRQAKLVEAAIMFTEAVTKACNALESLVEPGVFTFLFGLCRLLPQWIPDGVRSGPGRSCCLRRTPPPQIQVCVPPIGLKFPAPFINFVFCRRSTFLMWVGGSVGQPGAGQGPKHPPPPPPGGH